MGYMLSKICHWLGLPGFVRPFEYVDSARGLNVRITTSPLYTVLHVNGAEFFFNRESGKYDGIGAIAVEDAQPTTDCRVACIQQSTVPRVAAE